MGVTGGRIRISFSVSGIFYDVLDRGSGRVREGETGEEEEREGTD